MGPKKKNDPPKTGGTFSKNNFAESPRQPGARRADGQKVNTLGSQRCGASNTGRQLGGSSHVLRPYSTHRIHGKMAYLPTYSYYKS